MQQRRLGRDGPQIGAVALGTMNFCGTYGEADPDESLRCMAACLEMGVTHLDTSNVYGMGQAEELLARFLKQNRARVILASKGGITRDPEHPFDNSPVHLRQALEGSLRRLGLDHIDLYYLHRHEVARPIEDVMETLTRFRDEGKIGAIGLSEIAPGTLERALKVAPVAAVQSEYSLWTRQPDLGIRQACERHGVALVAFSPVGRGVFGSLTPDPAGFGKTDFRRSMPRFEPENWAYNRARLTRFGEFARDHGESPASIAIAWVLARGPHLIALPGSRSIAHMRENARGWAHGARYGAQMSVGPQAYC
jgi:aryl-alcohol dehydrogenase-like predicted oxidoreductase